MEEIKVFINTDGSKEREEFAKKLKKWVSSYQNDYKNAQKRAEMIEKTRTYKEPLSREIFGE